MRPMLLALVIAPTLLAGCTDTASYYAEGLADLLAAEPGPPVTRVIFDDERVNLTRDEIGTAAFAAAGILDYYFYAQPSQKADVGIAPAAEWDEYASRGYGYGRSPKVIWHSDESSVRNSVEVGRGGEYYFVVVCKTDACSVLFGLTART